VCCGEGAVCCCVWLSWHRGSAGVIGGRGMTSSELRLVVTAAVTSRTSRARTYWRTVMIKRPLALTGHVAMHVVRRAVPVQTYRTMAMGIVVIIKWLSARAM
jgi:hypothetical protein